MTTAALSLSGTENTLAKAVPPVDVASAKANPLPIKAFVVDSAGVDVAPLPQTGQTGVVVGGAGNDTVYVRKGTTITAAVLGGGNNKVFLTGAFADYAQATPVSGVYTLNRTGGLAAGLTEIIKVSAGGSDRLYFADGFVDLSNSNLALKVGGVASGAFTLMSTAALTVSVTEVTPSLSDQSSPVLLAVHSADEGGVMGNLTDTLLLQFNLPVNVSQIQQALSNNMLRIIGSDGVRRALGQGARVTATYPSSLMTSNFKLT